MFMFSNYVTEVTFWKLCYCSNVLVVMATEQVLYHITKRRPNLCQMFAILLFLRKLTCEKVP